MEMTINNDSFKKIIINFYFCWSFIRFKNTRDFADNDLELLVFENQSINNCLICNPTTFELSVDQYKQKLLWIICKSLSQ